MKPIIQTNETIQTNRCCLNLLTVLYCSFCLCKFVVKVHRCAIVSTAKTQLNQVKQVFNLQLQLQVSKNEKNKIQVYREHKKLFFVSSFLSIYEKVFLYFPREVCGH